MSHRSYSYILSSRENLALPRHPACDLSPIIIFFFFFLSLSHLFSLSLILCHSLSNCPTITVQNSTYPVLVGDYSKHLNTSTLLFFKPSFFFCSSHFYILKFIEYFWKSICQCWSAIKKKKSVDKEETTDKLRRRFRVLFFFVIEMGNTTTCSPKTQSPTKRASPMYRLKTSSPLPTHIHRCKEQIHPQPLFSPSKYKGNLFISIHALFADIHWLTTSSRSDSQESSPITLFWFTWICLHMFFLIGLDTYRYIKITEKDSNRTYHWPSVYTYTLEKKETNTCYIHRLITEREREREKKHDAMGC